jgi:predicted house-cleaning NTP pyrophosphatase (Maf/HAM1 superfamily)
MINQLLQQLNSQVKLVLASSSPRRLEILGIIGLKPEAI